MGLKIEGHQTTSHFYFEHLSNLYGPIFLNSVICLPTLFSLRWQKTLLIATCIRLSVFLFIVNAQILH